MMDDSIRSGINRIKPLFPGARFIVFGSRARGTARDDSDLDLYAVFPAILEDPFDVIHEIRKALHRELDLALDVVVADDEKFRESATHPWSLESVVAAEGITV